MDMNYENALYDEKKKSDVEVVQDACCYKETKKITTIEVVSLSDNAIRTRKLKKYINML